MLKIGVQTKGILDEYVKGEGIYEGFEQIASAGFEYIDFNLDVFLKNTDIYKGRINKFFDKTEEELIKFFTPYKDAMKMYGIRPSQMHAPYPVMVYGMNAQNRYMVENVIPKSLFIANFLEIPYVVIHPIKLQYSVGKKEERDVNLEYFKSLIPLAKKYDVTICMENLYESFGNRIVEGVCADPDDIVWYMENLNEAADEEWFGVCLDTGHLNLVKREPYEFIMKVGKYLKILHIHDNDGVGDLHQMPFSFGMENGSGTGIIWQQVIDGLRDIGYKGVLSFETFPTVNSFPVRDKRNVLEMIAAIGSYMAEQIG